MDIREKLVELFYDNNVRCDQKIEGLADDVMDIIAHDITVPQWISVNDRMPEFRVSVLARCFYNGKWRTLVCHTSKEHAGEWYTDEVCQWVKVTHWMPLPSELSKEA